VSGRALVAYGGRHGSTAQIAEAIAATLREEGVEVDLHPAGEVTALEPYPAVVLGSAVYFGRWHRDARALLHHAQLSGRDVLLFSSGPFGVRGARGGRFARPRRVERRASELGAHEHVVFGGAIGAQGGPLRRLFARATPSELRDRRDWARIEAWARQIAGSIVNRAG
jgi:menaquinone-dependent protoporphyrinogen oxidase